MVFLQETGGGQTVRWKELEAVSNCELVGDGTIRISPRVTEARFSGRTDPSSHPIDATEASVSIEIRRFQRRKTGGAA